MFEKFTAANAQDFRTRYQGTFGFYREENREPILAKLNLVDGFVGWSDKRGQTYELMPDSKKDIGFAFLPPKSGFTNTEDGAMYVTRRAARQFSRGISERNTTMFVVTAAGWREAPINFKYLEKVYESKITKEAAFKKFKDKEVGSFALSNHFCMTREQLYVFDNPAGVVDFGDTLKLKLNDPALFRTEISDALRGLIKVEFV